MLRGQFPCKITTGILPGSRRDLGGNPVGIPARFWPPGFFFPAGISPGNEIPGGQNLAGILPRISPRFSPGSKNHGGQNLAGMLPRISPRFSPRSKFTVAKISVQSCRESRQDWRREAKFLVRFTVRIPTKFQTCCHEFLLDQAQCLRV